MLTNDQWKEVLTSIKFLPHDDVKDTARRIGMTEHGLREEITKEVYKPYGYYMFVNQGSAEEGKHHRLLDLNAEIRRSKQGEDFLLQLDPNVKV